jgi:parvulin-like peptidyl-prolyl isomerase
MNADHGVRVRRLLGLGAALGLAFATSDLLSFERATNVPAGSVARVNDTFIREEDYARALSAFASDRRSPVEEVDRRHVLDRLIDEELLVQRGLDLGLAKRDRRVRADVVAAMLDAITSEAKTTEPGDEEVAAFYESERDYFARPGRVHARRILVQASSTRPDAEARRRAVEAAKRLRAGEDFALVRSQLGDPEVATLPDTALPAVKLREYVGPTATRALLAAAPGEVSEPIRSAGGYQVLQLVDRTGSEVPPLAEIEAEVRAELRRRAADQALRTYLEDLRRSGDVQSNLPPA